MSNPATPGPTNVAGIILAAGESTRMGRDKALLPLGQRSFLEHLAFALVGEVSPLLVILGHHAGEIQQQVRLPSSARIVHNPNYKDGQISSLQTALRSLGTQPVAGALMCLVDHPAVTKGVVHALLRQFQQTPAAILLPTYKGRRGHPVLFAARLFDELLSAPLAEGARAVVRAHEHEIESVAVDEEGILWDVDRPEDYEAIQQRWKVIEKAPPSPAPS